MRQLRSAGTAKGQQWARLVRFLLAMLSAWPLVTSAQVPPVDTGGRSAQSATVLATGVGHRSWVSSVAISPDGSWLASAGEDRTVRLWDLGSGREIKAFMRHLGSGVISIAFSPDGRQLASAEAAGTIRLWDVASGREVRAFTGHGDLVHSVAFSPDGRQVASASSDKTARLWDVASGRQIKALTGHGVAVLSVAFSPDGRQLASAGYEDKVRLWDVASGRLLRLLSGHRGAIGSVVFSRDGTRLASTGSDRTVRLWDAGSGREIRALSGHRESVSAVAFSPDGRQLASADFDGTVRLWDAASGREVRALQGHGNSVTSVAFSPDGRLLAAPGSDNNIRLWDLSTGREIKTFEGSAVVMSTAVFSPDGRQFASAGADGTVRLWDGTSGRETGALRGHNAPVCAVAYSPVDRKLASVSADKTVRLWDVDSGREIRAFSGPSDCHVRNIAFSRDGTRLASASGEDSAHLWDVASGREIQVFKVRGSLLSIALSPDARHLALGAWHGDVSVWDVDSGRKVWDLTGKRGTVTAIAFSANGQHLATASAGDGGIRLWDVASGRETTAFNVDHSKSTVLSFAFSPDGTHLASGDDSDVRLWDVASGREIRKFIGHSHPVRSVGFSPDGKLLISGADEPHLKLWGAVDGTPLSSLISFVDGSWAVTEPGGRYDSSHNGENPNLHWIVGLTPIGIEQLKERYYDPGLLAKVLGFKPEPLRTVPAFDSAAVKLPPVVALSMGAAPSSATLPQVLARIRDTGGGIGRVRVRLNGKELLSDASAQLGTSPDGKTRDLRLTVPADRLTPGNNVVDVIAFNADNHIQSRLVSMSFAAPTSPAAPADARGAQRVDVAAPAVAVPPTLFVIAAGVSQYAAPDQRLNLQFAGKDAVDLTQALLLGGQRLFGVGRVQAHLLTDAPAAPLQELLARTGGGNSLKVAAPGRGALQAAFASVAQVARPTDIVVVLLAGHGVMTAGSGLDTGDYHYLTREAQSTDLSDPAVRQLWAVSSAELTEWTKAIKANKQVLVLDTCAAGGAVEKLVAPRNLPGSHTIALERLKDRTGFHVLAGAAADQVSYEASRYGQGLLTYALLSGLRGAALREGEFADISTLFQYAVDEVPKLAKGVGGIQRPLLASPRGSSFDIGRLTAEDKKQVPLAQIRPLILRAQIQSEDFRDSLRLEGRLNAYLRAQNQGTARGTLMFVDADEHPDGWKLRARYRRQGEGYLLEGVLFQGEQEKGRVKLALKADEATQVGELMLALKREMKD